MRITAETKFAEYDTTPKYGDIVAGAEGGRGEVQIIGGGAEKGATGMAEETARKRIRDVPNRGGGPGQEKPEETAEETAEEKAGGDGGAKPG